MFLVLVACTQNPDSFSITLGGDVMLARAGKSIFTDGSQLINPWVELENTGLMADSLNDPINDPINLFFVNLESPLGSGQEQLHDMNLCAEASNVDVLLQGSIDLVSLANNHRDDCMIDGWLGTRSILSENGINSTRVDFVPVFIEIPDGKLAVLSAEDVTGGVVLDSLLTAVTNARAVADVVIVSMHWGNEYQAGPDDRQEELAQRLADAGADVIWGHHPHVLQRMEWLTSADGRDVLGIYSLGNLLSDQWMLEDAQRSALITLNYHKQEIIAIEILPIKMSRTDRLLHLVTDQESRSWIIERLQIEKLKIGGVTVSVK